MTPMAQALGEATRLVCGTLLGLELVPADAGTFAPDAGTLTGTVEIHGAWEGHVVVRCPWPLGRLAAEVMYGSPDRTMAEVSDAVGEIANMVAGAVKATLPRPSQLALPAVTLGPALPPAVAGALLLGEADLRHEPETLRVSLWQRAAVTAAVRPRADGPGWYL